MLCGDVPWVGSSRRSLSLQAPCTCKSTCVLGAKAQPSCLRERVSLAARFERNLADGVGALPHACGGSAPRGWIEPQWLGGRRSQGHQTVERREQLTCRGAWLLQLGLAASSTRSVFIQRVYLETPTQPYGRSRSTSALGRLTP